jgi:nitrogen fixation/metabolism regulation signal transduction histidine kinase
MVREAAMKLLANPIFLRSAVVFIFATFSFLLGMFIMRKLRESITDEADLSFDGSPSFETMPLHVYNMVIQQLKQQKHELQAESHAELQRARASEIFSQAVISRLSCGVLIFGSNGLVKSSNPAAKQILGFASPVGMKAEDVFRGTVISNAATNDPSANPVSSDLAEDAGESTSLHPVTLADEVDAVLREGSQRREVETEFETPAGEKRFIGVAISRVAEGELLGAICLINDLSELHQLRQNRNSLAAAAGSAG